MHTLKAGKKRVRGAHAGGEWPRTCVGEMSREARFQHARDRLHSSWIVGGVISAVPRVRR